jgi:hypothetical protein
VLRGTISVISYCIYVVHSMVFDLKTRQLFALLILVELLTITRMGGIVLYGTIIVIILIEYTYYKV